MTAADLTRFQQDAARHLSFSLTLACPLACAHCMVATVSPKEGPGVTLPLYVAERFAAEMPALADMGIARVSFTGGEPLLAGPQIALLSSAAAAAGIGCTVVTACHWAKTEAVAARTIERFQEIDTWHLSSDIFHMRELDPGFVVNAARAAQAAGRTVTIRMAVSRDPDDAETRLVDALVAALPAGTPVAMQPVVPHGRAKGLARASNSGSDTPPAVPCVTTGPLIRHDGRLLPCCSGLAETPENSPFAAVDAARDGLVAAVRAWRGDPLLSLVRATGFAVPAVWAGEHAVRPAPDNPCDYCTALWSRPAARTAALRQTARPEVRDHIAELGRAVFGASPEPAEE